MTAANPWTGNWAPSADADVRLFCLPHAGGSASAFRTWRAALPVAIDVCAVQLPGRSGRWREAPLTDVAALVQAATAGLSEYLDRPFALFGHSLGALVAFELARNLRRHGEGGPVTLFVSGCNAAQLHPLPAPIAHLDDNALLQRLRTLGGLPLAVLAQPDLMAFYLPLLRADLTAAESYVYAAEPPLACPITVFAGTEDPETSGDGVRAWKEQTGGTFTVCELPGDHFFVHSAEGRLIETIVAQLAQVTALRR